MVRYVTVSYVMLREQGKPALASDTVRVETVRVNRNAVRHVAAAAFRGRVAATLLVLDLSHNQIAHLLRHLSNHTLLTFPVRSRTWRPASSRHLSTSGRSISATIGWPTSGLRCSARCLTCTTLTFRFVTS